MDNSTQKSFVFGGRRMTEAPSTYNRETAAMVFGKIDLNAGDVLIDLGCGTGNFSLHAAEIVGPQGKVLAVDTWAEMLEKVNLRAREADLKNITTIENNICEGIALNDNQVDVCFISNVLHGQKLTDQREKLLHEVVRILKPGGRLAIIEFKKEKTPFGPPLSIRITPEELEKGISDYGFQKKEFLDFTYHYMMSFEKQSKIVDRLW